MNKKLLTLIFLSVGSCFTPIFSNPPGNNRLADIRIFLAALRLSNSSQSEPGDSAVEAGKAHSVNFLELGLKSRPLSFDEVVSRFNGMRKGWSQIGSSDYYSSLGSSNISWDLILEDLLKTLLQNRGLSDCLSDEDVKTFISNLLRSPERFFGYVLCYHLPGICAGDLILILDSLDRDPSISEILGSRFKRFDIEKRYNFLKTLLSFSHRYHFRYLNISDETRKSLQRKIMSEIFHVSAKKRSSVNGRSRLSAMFLRVAGQPSVPDQSLID